MREKVIGIYKFENLVNGKVYIGQSVHVWQRKNQHLSDLRQGKHCCKYLQKAFNKHGEHNFQFSLIEQCERHALTAREQHWMDFYKEVEIYNSSPAAGSNAGFKHSEESKMKMSSAQKMRPPPSKETLERRSQALRGRKQPLSFSLRMSEIHKGKTLTEETRKKLSEYMKGRTAYNKGKPMSEEQKRKLSIANTGYKRPQWVKDKIAASSKGRVFSEEHRKKLSEALMGNVPSTKGKKRDPEIGKKISAAKKGKPNGLLGKKLTEEHKNNMRLGQLKKLGKA